MENNTLRIMSIGALLVVALFLFSGCVSNTNNPPANNTTTNTTNTTGGYTPPAGPTDSELAGSVSGGTGSGSDDISEDELSAMEDDLDDLDTAVDESQESDI